MTNEQEPAARSEWWPSNEDGVLAAYIAAHYEFDFGFSTGRPYRRLWSDSFRSVPGRGAWKVKRDSIGNDLTADLIAVIELLSLPMCFDIYGSGFRGYTEGMRAWMPALDGGLYVEFTMHETESNSLVATQTTCVDGHMTLRYCLIELGFDLPKRRLEGEDSPATEEEMRQLIERQSTLGTPESIEIRAKATRAAADELKGAISKLSA